MTSEESTPSCVMVTGANVGLGLECARQLAEVEGIKKVILACRSPEKAEAAKLHLEQVTSTSSAVFEIVIIDVSNLESVKQAVKSIQDKNIMIDGLVMNAGGAGGAEPHKSTKDGVTNSMAANLLGHVYLVDELIQSNLLLPSASVIYAGSESARGIPEMGLATPELQSGSVEEFVSICNGSFLSPDEILRQDGLQKLSKLLGGYAKYVGALWMSSMARKFPTRRFVTISPGATSGTTVTRDLPWYEQVKVRTIVYILSFLGKSHSLQVGAKRYVDALLDDETYQSGIFYGSKVGLSGDVCDQATFLKDFAKESYQDNAYTAIHTFLP